ncbi:MAG: hypothetical protein NT007_16360 [Candidatus Kapabacteria bacterium]|nr:hypothetical protein [Candidatus Kapabacteria bacterium]
MINIVSYLKSEAFETASLCERYIFVVVGSEPATSVEINSMIIQYLG